MDTTRSHWDRVYASRAFTEVSWYQADPARSLALIEGAAPSRSSAVIDVGCGAGVLLGALSARGFADLTGLDASDVAIADAQARLGTAGARIRWIAGDITQWTPGRRYAVWHDRAVFHFLIVGEEQEAYLRALRQALPAGGAAIIATFALDGPETCSGLPVRRYSGETLAARLGDGFSLVSETREKHVTPKGAAQNFTYSELRRR